MKKLVATALGALLVFGVVADTASAAQRSAAHHAARQQPVRGDDDGFRNSYNSYGTGGSRFVYDGLAEGGAVSAPAGR